MFFSNVFMMALIVFSLVPLISAEGVEPRKKDIEIMAPLCPVNCNRIPFEQMQEVCGTHVVVKADKFDSYNAGRYSEIKSSACNRTTCRLYILTDEGTYHGEMDCIQKGTTTKAACTCNAIKNS
uniref:Uncharacterized protein n=1 Tax=Cacopsylla melanoneura TaxID=428564 RepID=A0A8D9F384_9HEMI